MIDEIAGGGDVGHRAWPHGRSGRRRDREGCCAGALGGVVFPLPTLPAGNVQYEHVLRSRRFTFLIQKHLYLLGIKYRTKLLVLFYVPPFSFGNMVVR